MKTTSNLLFKIEAGNYPIWQGGGVSKETDCERDFPFLAATSSSISDVVTQCDYYKGVSCSQRVKLLFE